MVLTLFGCLKGMFSKQHGEYETNEDKNMKSYDNADAAVAMSKTGQPEVPLKREWFI